MIRLLIAAVIAAGLLYLAWSSVHDKGAMQRRTTAGAEADPELAVPGVGGGGSPRQQAQRVRDEIQRRLREGARRTEAAADLE